MADWLELGEGWTDELRSRCQDRCGEEFGDPPCWSLAGDTRHGDTPLEIVPCEDCIANAD